MADATGIVVSRLRTKGPSGYRYYTFRATTSTSETIPIAGLSTIIGAIGKAAATAGALTMTWATNILTVTQTLTDDDVNGIVWGVPA